MTEEKIESKIGKIYKRFIGPNSIGMSKNLENGIRKALRVAVVQNSKRLERQIVERGRQGLVEFCERNLLVDVFPAPGTDRESYLSGWRDAHLNMKSTADLPDHFRSQVWGERVVETLEE